MKDPIENTNEALRMDKQDNMRDEFEAFWFGGDLGINEYVLSVNGYENRYGDNEQANSAWQAWQHQQAKIDDNTHNYEQVCKIRLKQIKELKDG